MNLAQIKERAIQLLNEYSNNGNLITQKNADYILRMNSLIDDAQFEISKTRKIIADPVILTTPDIKTENYNKFKMPSNFMELHSLIYNDIVISDIRFEGNNILLIPTTLTLPLTMYYYKYPKTIDKATSDDIELEIDIDAQKIVPYYVGGHCKIDEEPQLAIQLLNEYQLKLSRLLGDNNYSITSIANIYYS